MAEVNIAAMLGVMNAYPEIDEWMRADLRDDNHQRERFLFPLHKCANACKKLATPLAGEDVSSLFKNEDSFLYKYKDILEEIGVMGRNISYANRPKYPLFFFYGSEDEFTRPIEDTEELVNKWRLKSLTVVHQHKLNGQSHTSALVPGLLLAWPWMTRRFQAAEAAALLGKSIDDVRDFQGLPIGDSELDDSEVGIQTQILLGTGASHEL